MPACEPLAPYAYAVTTIKCTVMGTFSETYGKMPDDGSDRQIILEFENFMDTIAQSSEFSPICIKDKSTADYITNWMQSVPDLTY